jgi:hypothetical protein
MARGTQLETLIYMLRAETGQSVLVSAGVDNKPSLTQIINRAQQVLADDFNWPFLKIMPFKDLEAGERYYNLTSDFGGLDIERVVSVAVWDNGQPSPIVKGIGFAEYAQYDSNDDVRSSPVQRWDVKYTDDTGDSSVGEQIEVWPIPDDNNQRLQFEGYRSVPLLVEDSDRAMLDDQLIVLTAATEVLARQGNKDAPLKQRIAKARYQQLRARYSSNDEPIIMGGGVNRPNNYRGKTIITVR